MKKPTELLDLILEHGADIEAWADRPVDCHSKENDTGRKCYIDDFVPAPDKTVNVLQRKICLAVSDYILDHDPE